MYGQHIVTTFEPYTCGWARQRRALTLSPGAARQTLSAPSFPCPVVSEFRVVVCIPLWVFTFQANTLLSYATARARARVLCTCKITVQHPPAASTSAPRSSPFHGHAHAQQVSQQQHRDLSPCILHWLRCTTANSVCLACSVLVESCGVVLSAPFTIAEATNTSTGYQRLPPRNRARLRPTGGVDVDSRVPEKGMRTTVCASTSLKRVTTMSVATYTPHARARVGKHLEIHPSLLDGATLSLASKLLGATGKGGGGACWCPQCSHNFQKLERINLRIRTPIAAMTLCGLCCWCGRCARDMAYSQLNRGSAQCDLPSASGSSPRIRAPASSTSGLWFLAAA